MTPPDERRGVPSASEMPRLIHCPAAHHMCKLAPADTDTKDADAGTEVHSILSEDLSADDASHSAAQTAEMCDEQAELLVMQWREGDGYVQRFSERRYGLTPFNTALEVTPESTATFVFTGKFDRLYIQGNDVLLMDFKALHGHHARAVDNAQLMSLAVLVAKRHRLKSLRIALVQPWRGKPTVADLGEQALQQAETWLGQHLLRIAQATPDDRKAGEWCTHCRAGKSGRCEVFNAYAHRVPEPLNAITIAGADPETQRKALFVRALELPPEKHAAMVRGAPMLKRMYDAIMASAKQRAAEDPEFQRFYTLRERAGRRSISNVGEVFSRVNAKGVSAEDFTAECSVPMGAVKELLKKATGAKGKALDAITNEVLEGLTETSKPSMELVEVNQIEG